MYLKTPQTLSYSRATDTPLNFIFPIAKKQSLKSNLSNEKILPFYEKRIISDVTQIGF